MKDLKYNFVFFYPSMSIGGAQILFAKVAEMLLKKGCNVTILGDKNCYINNYLDNKELVFNKVEVSENLPYKSSKNEFFILSLSYIVIFKKYIDADEESKFLFWDLHPYALVESLALSKFHKRYSNKVLISILSFFENAYIKKIKKIIEIGNEKGGIHFMCYRNFLTNKNLFSLNFSPDYLPIPIKVDKYVDYKQDKNQICWISRLDEDKTNILKFLIEDVILYNNKNANKLTLHIIGDGDNVEYVKEITSEHINFFLFPGILYGNHLSEYLINNQIKIGFAMGTSSLEFASRKIATVLVPSMTEKDFYTDKRNRYLWIYDSYGYDVAVERFHFDENILQSFNEIMESKDDNDVLSYEYVLQTHSEEKVFSSLLERIDKNQFLFSNIEDSGIFNLTVMHKMKSLSKNLIDK